MVATLVELCAGSAAVSLRWLHPRAKPPIAYQGGKRSYASAILLAMGLRPGGGQRSGRVVLVEQGPWGEAWAHWVAGGVPDTVARLRAWASEDPRELWTRLKSAPVPSDRAERVATWAVLRLWQFSMGTVAIEGETWALAGGFNRGGAYAAEYHAEYLAAGGNPDRYVSDCFTIDRLIENFGTVPLLDVLDVRHCDARTVEPIPGAYVYFDPPYRDTTGYGHALSREDVIAIARRWQEAGCTVAISEQEPLPIAGWHHYELGKPIGNRRTFSKQKREWLTLSRPAVGVLDFGGSK